MRDNQGERGESAVLEGARDPGRGEQRAEGGLAGDHLRRHTRPVLRPEGAVPRGRRRARDQLPVPGRLRRPRLLLGGDLPAAARAQSALPGPHHAHPGQPRVAPDHSGLRLLRRVPAQVRLDLGVAVLHRGVRLHQPVGHNRRQDLLRARRPLALHQHARPDPRHRPQAGGAARGAHVRPAMVRPGGDHRLGREPARRWLPVRQRRGQPVQSDQ